MPRKKKEISIEQEITRSDSKIYQIDQATGACVVVPADEAYIKVGSTKDEKNKGTRILGAVVPKGNRVSVDYLRNSREYARYSVSDDIYKLIELSKVMYTKESIVGTTIDIFVNYAMTDMDLEGLDESTPEFATLKYFLENVNKDNTNMETGLNGLTCELALETWLSGNSFPYKVIGEVPSIDIDSKKMRARTIKMPTEIFLLDPLSIEIDPVSVVNRRARLYQKLDATELKHLRNAQQMPDPYVKRYSEDFVKLVKQDPKIRSRPLDPEFIDHLKRKSLGYQMWGVPYLTKLFADVARKKKLQALDEATIDGIINNITVFKIGLPDNPETWGQDRLLAFTYLLGNNVHPSNYLVWTPDVEVLEVRPKSDTLGLDKKYDEVNKAILIGLGVPSVLLSGEGISSDNQGNVWVAVSPLMEQIESVRKMIKAYIEKVMFEILVMNKLNTSKKPRIRWMKPNLRNEKEYRDFALQLYDRGILPYETTVKEAQYNWDETLRRREEDNEKSRDDIFKRRDNIAFSKEGEPSPGSPGGKGRPKGTSPKGTKPKTTKPTKPTPVKSTNESIFADASDLILQELEMLKEECINDLNERNNNYDMYVNARMIRVNDIIESTCSLYNKESASVINKLNSIKTDFIENLSKTFEMNDGFVINSIFEKSFNRFQSDIQNILIS